MAVKWKFYWVLVGLTLALYAVMVLWSLPKIAGSAGGLMPFDMRPAGYDSADVRAFLAAISPAGVAFYLGTQHWLDTAYPAMLAATLSFGALGLTRTGWRFVGWAVVVSAVAGAVSDYVENQLVAALLRTGPDGFADGDQTGAATATLLKSGLTTVAMVLILLLLIRSLVSYVKGRRA